MPYQHVSISCSFSSMAFARRCPVLLRTEQLGSKMVANSAGPLPHKGSFQWMMQEIAHKQCRQSAIHNSQPSLHLTKKRSCFGWDTIQSYMIVIFYVAPLSPGATMNSRK